MSVLPLRVLNRDIVVEYYSAASKSSDIRKAKKHKTLARSLRSAINIQSQNKTQENSKKQVQGINGAW
jgi:hypothetical protein